MNRIDGKVALITGGAKGQGAAEAELLIAAGARVVITDVLDDEGAARAETLGDACSYLHHDVSSEDEWASVVDAVFGSHGSIDVLVNNAGIFGAAGLEDTTVEQWNKIIAVNQTGVFLGMRSVAPTMKQQGSGSIINISSIGGFQAAPKAHAYGATKWAVRGMTKSAAVELAPFGVRANSVHPGIVATDMIRDFAPDMRARLEASIPMGHVAEPMDIAKLVLFLASDDSAYCTGQEYVIDGGLLS